MEIIKLNARSRDAADNTIKFYLEQINKEANSDPSKLENDRSVYFLSLIPFNRTLSKKEQGRSKGAEVAAPSAKLNGPQKLKCLINCFFLQFYACIGLNILLGRTTRVPKSALCYELDLVN